VSSSIVWDVDLRVSVLRAAVVVASVALAVLVSGPRALADETRCVEELAKPAPAAALKPPGVLLAMSAPRAGETIVGVGSTDSITLSVDYWGPGLVDSGAARAIDEYHLAYFLDEDAMPYVDGRLPIPRCNPYIVHSSALRVTFEHVRHGSHTITVVLTGSNNVSVNPTVATRVWFLVR
jgi:hypothetical protein